MSETTRALNSLQRKLGYTFKDEGRLAAALTHSSASSDRCESNERMEFLGDAVLGLVVCEELYRRYPNYQEGEMTKIKSAVVSRRVCAEVADALGLPAALRLGKGMDGGENMPKSLAAAVLESVIAAIYLDGGLEAARTFILKHVDAYITSIADSEHRDNYKSQLQQYAQRTWNAVPQYDLLDEKGPDHSKCFEVAVSIGTRQFPGAWGPNKKEAEQKAARRALIELGVIDADEPDVELE